MKRIIASFALIGVLSLATQVFAERDLETGVFLSRDPAGFVDGPNVYAYVKENPWSAFDPHGLANLNLTSTLDLSHGAFEDRSTDGIGTFTVGGHSSFYPGQTVPTIGDDRKTNPYRGPVISASKLLQEMKNPQKTGVGINKPGTPYKDGTPIILLACESAFESRTDTLAPEMAKLAKTAVAGMTKTLWTHDVRSGGNGVMQVNGEIHISRGPKQTELVKEDTSKPGHVQWYDPSGQPIRPPNWSPLHPERGYPAKVDLSVPAYVNDHMTNYWKNHSVESSAKKQNTNDPKKK